MQECSKEFRWIDADRLRIILVRSRMANMFHKECFNEKFMHQVFFNMRGVCIGLEHLPPMRMLPISLKIFIEEKTNNQI